MVGDERCGCQKNELYFLIEETIAEVDNVRDLLVELQYVAKVFPLLPSYTDKR